MALDGWKKDEGLNFVGIYTHTQTHTQAKLSGIINDDDGRGLLVVVANSCSWSRD
jgi:hypothetical protein